MSIDQTTLTGTPIGGSGRDCASGVRWRRVAPLLWDLWHRSQCPCEQPRWKGLGLYDALGRIADEQPPRAAASLLAAKMPTHHTTERPMDTDDEIAKTLAELRRLGQDDRRILAAATARAHAQSRRNDLALLDFIRECRALVLAGQPLPDDLSRAPAS